MDFLTDWIKTIVAEVTEAIGGVMVDWAETAFFIEIPLSNVLSTSFITQMQSFTYAVGVLLVILKFMSKGAKIYILDRDGDSETSPIEMLKGFALAIVTMVAFPMLYQYLASITIWVCNKVVSLVGGGVYDAFSILKIIDKSGIVNVILLIVFLVMLIGIYFSYIKRGAELFILRLGMPFAVAGLLDSDNGSFKPYVQQFFKCAFTTIVQTFCVNVALLLIVVASNMNYLQNMVYAICFLMAAKSMPALLNQFLIGGGSGGGAMQKVSSVAMVANSIRSFIK